MNARGVFHLVAYMLMVLGLGEIGSALVGGYFDDPLRARYALWIGAAVNMVVGGVMAWTTRGTINLSRRDGFGIVTFGWLFAAVFGALPFIISGVIPHPVSAVFETMSGFTTTGASVLSQLEAQPRGILFWRALTHLFGGMGVLVLCVAILPFLGVGGMQIFRAEVPGPSKDRLTPRIATTAKLLWGVYMLLCLIEILLLHVGRMSWFDSFCHTFATMATGGFSTRSASIGAYHSLYIEIVIIVFMFLAGANFALHYRALTGKPSVYGRDPEFRFYLGFWLTACLLLAGINMAGMTSYRIGAALRDAFFTGTSIMTTTGFCTADFDLWPNASRLLLVLLMFLGGCAGSTGGGMKVVRVTVVFKTILAELKRFMNPQAVFSVKLGKHPLDETTVAHIAAFFMIFLLLFGIGTVIMTFYTPDVETAYSSVIATMGNIGPGLGEVGATRNYAAIPAVGKSFLIVFMLLGRLELYTVLIVLLPGFWKK